VKIGLAIRDVRDAEAALGHELGRIGERHRADHDVFHLSRTLIKLHHANLEALAPFGERYGTSVDPADAEGGEGPLARARERMSELTGRRPEAGLLLLLDLRRLHLLYAEASVNWVLLGQGAQAVRDAELLAVVDQCHTQTLRGMKWTLTRLKTAAPQVLAG
jgi:hypothetical protein